MANYRNVKIKSGTFYERDSNPRDGFKEVKLQNGNITYHKEDNLVEGDLYKIVLNKDGKYGAEVKMYFNQKEKDLVHVVQLPLKDSRGNYNPYLKSIVQVADNMELDKRYKLFVNYKDKNDKGFPWQNIIIMDSDGKFIDWSIKPEDFPKIIKGKDKLGSDVYDNKAQQEFIGEKLAEIFEKFKGNTDNNSNEKVKTSNNSETKEPDNIGDADYDDDDLPF